MKFSFQEQLDNNNIVSIEHSNIPGAEQVKIKFKDTDYMISCVRGSEYLHDELGWEVWDFGCELYDPESMSVNDINKFVNALIEERKLILIK